MDECLCCLDEDCLEYVSNGNTWWCHSCGAHFHEMALKDGHYFNDGRQHVMLRVNGVYKCVPAIHI